MLTLIQDSLRPHWLRLWLLGLPGPAGVLAVVNSHSGLFLRLVYPAIAWLLVSPCLSLIAVWAAPHSRLDETRPFLDRMVAKSKLLWLTLIAQGLLFLGVLELQLND